MSRKLRFSLPGIPLHIVQRGHNRELYFFKNSVATPVTVCDIMCLNENNQTNSNEWIYTFNSSFDMELHLYSKVTFSFSTSVI